MSIRDRAREPSSSGSGSGSTSLGACQTCSRGRRHQRAAWSTANGVAGARRYRSCPPSRKGATTGLPAGSAPQHPCPRLWGSVAMIALIFTAHRRSAIALATRRRFRLTRASRRRASSSLSGAAATGSVVAGLAAAGYAMWTIGLPGKESRSRGNAAPGLARSLAEPGSRRARERSAAKEAVRRSPIPRQNATRSGQSRQRRSLAQRCLSGPRAVAGGRRGRPWPGRGMIG